MIWQIVLWILKLIGWILLAVVVILLLSLCLILFAPFCYEGKGGCEGTKETLWGRLRFSMFFHLIDGWIEYAEGKSKWHFRIAWKTLDPKSEEQVMETAEKAVEEIPVKIREETEEATKKKEKEPEKKSAEKSAEKSTEAQKEEPKKRVSSDRKEPEKKRFFERIEYTFQTFCDKMNVLTEKKETIFAFLEDEIHHAAFFKAIQTLKRLLKRLRPRRFTGKVRFGFEDPSVTGKVLAVISMIAPFWEGSIDVEPEFDEKILTGELEIAGSIAVWKFAAFAVSLLMDKNIRKTIMHIRNFKF